MLQGQDKTYQKTSGIVLFYEASARNSITLEKWNFLSQR